MDKDMKKFWNWTPSDDGESRVLHINGTIGNGDTWYDDDVTPAEFKEELGHSNDTIVIWINSPGGDVFAASQIYTMLMDYPGKVIVKIDGIAASAASVIAMAGTEVLMSPTAMMMIHNPSSEIWGDSKAMIKQAEVLEEVKESIINAYEIKTGQKRGLLSDLMDQETWMDAHHAMDYGFCDGMLKDESDTEQVDIAMYSPVILQNSISSKIIEQSKIEKKETRCSADSLLERLNILEKS